MGPGGRADPGLAGETPDLLAAPTGRRDDLTEQVSGQRDSGRSQLLLTPVLVGPRPAAHICRCAAAAVRLTYSALYPTIWQIGRLNSPGWRAG